MTRELALMFFDAWKMNVYVHQLPEEALHYLWEFSFARRNSTFRSHFARLNRSASDAFYDGHFRRGWQILLKVGFNDKSSSRPNVSQTVWRNTASKLLAKNRLEWLGAEQWREKNAKRAWNVCKP